MLYVLQSIMANNMAASHLLIIHGSMTVAHSTLFYKWGECLEYTNLIEGYIYLAFWFYIISNYNMAYNMFTIYMYNIYGKNELMIYIVISLF